jgi:hypothetical protein
VIASHFDILVLLYYCTVDKVDFRGVISLVELGNIENLVRSRLLYCDFDAVHVSKHSNRKRLEYIGSRML